MVRVGAREGPPDPAVSLQHRRRRIAAMGRRDRGPSRRAHRAPPAAGDTLPAVLVSDSFAATLSPSRRRVPREHPQAAERRLAAISAEALGGGYPPRVQRNTALLR